MKLLSIGAAAVPTTLVIAALAAPVSLPASDELLKCRMPAGWTVADQRHVVDAQFRKAVSSGRMRFDRPYSFEDMEVTTDILHRIAVVCWDPVMQVLKMGAAGEPVVYVTTKPFMAKLHADLERIVAAQDALRKKNSRYAADMAELDVVLQTTGVSFTLIRHDEGWEATAASNLLIEACHVFAGSVAPPREELVEREPACFVLPEFGMQ